MNIVYCNTQECRWNAWSKAAKCHVCTKRLLQIDDNGACVHLRKPTPLKPYSETTKEESDG